MPITRSRTSSEQSTPENVTAGVASVDKESVVKDLKAAVASPEKAEKAKEITEPTNGTCPRVTDSGDVQPDKVEKGDDNGAAADSVETKAAPVADDADAAVTDGDKEPKTAAKEEPNGKDAGLQAADTEAATAANGILHSAVSDNDKTSEVKIVNQVQETEAKDLSGEVCAKRKTEEDEVSGEADSTCKRNKIEAEPAEQAAAN